MKTIIFSLLFFPFLTFAAGTEISGGGGNGAVAEFKRMGEDSLSILANRSNSTAETRKFNAHKALSTFQKTLIESTKENLMLEGKDVNAINYPSQNRIVFEESAWLYLDKVAKLQLVIHEIIGLTHRDTLDDSDYRLSKSLAELTLRMGVENVALALAQANYYNSQLPQVQTKRTKEIQLAQGDDEKTVTRVYVQTFENSSSKAVRIYHIYEDITGSVVKAELVGSEGPVGP